MEVCVSFRDYIPTEGDGYSLKECVSIFDAISITI